MKYFVTIPENAGDHIKFAAEELKFFLEKITGGSVAESVEKSDVIFSLGETLPFIDSGIEKTEYKTEDDSELLLIGNVYYLFGASDYAVMFGVYETLKALFGLRIFTETDFTFTSSVPKEIGRIKFSPDIPVRTVGIYPVYSQNERYMRRLKLYQAMEKWGVWAHSYFYILPPKIYADKHPDWYTADKHDLCLTNVEMRAEFTERLKNLILSTPDCVYYMLGQEDNKSTCGCEKCKAALNRYNNFSSGLMLEFSNDIVSRINEWKKTACPERKLEFVTFAYLKTAKAPVVIRNGKYRLIKENLHTLPNLSVMIAPSGATSSYSYFDERNTSCYAPNFKSDEAYPTAESIYAWKAVTDKLFFWSYSANFLDYNVPFLMWNGFDQNYREYKKLNVQYIFEEGAYSWRSVNFTELKAYIAAELSWDSSQDMNVLITDFMKAYYGDGYEYVREYFDFLNDYRETVIKETGVEAFYGKYDDFDYLCSGKYWSKEFLDKALSVIYKAVDKFFYKGYQKFTEKEWRIFGETLSCEYLLLCNYIKEMSDETVNEKVLRVTAIAEHFGMIDEKLGELASPDLSLRIYTEKWLKQTEEI